HLLTIQPGGYMTAFGAYFHFIPSFRVELFVLQLGIGLNKPTPSIGFVNAGSTVARRRYLYLPAADSGPFDIRTDKNPAIAVGLQFEFYLQYEILVFFIGR